MAFDANPFANLKTFADYQKADQAFQLQKAAQQQALQSGGIDAASKSNIYATQVLSGAVAGGQPAYDQAKQGLNQMGIDTSNWAPDVETGAQQAQAARLAQSPLGSLLNAGLKGEANNIAATQAMGSVTGGQQLDPLSQSLMGKIGLGAAQASQPPIQSNVVPAPKTAMTAPQQSAALSDIYSAPPEATTNVMPNATANTPASSIPRFNPPAQQQGETNQAYNQRVQTAFEAYKADPNYVQANAAAAASGKDQAEANKAAIGAGANYDQVVQTINGIKDLVNSPAGLPQDRGFIPASTQAKLSQNIGGTTLGNVLGIAPQAQADNENAFTKLNEAQTIGAIKELASTGQIRMTRTLENILNRGYLIEPGASSASKSQQANLILAELNNSKIAAQNVNSGLNGGQATPLQAMPTANAAPQGAPTGATLYGTSGGKSVYKLPDGSFVMEQ